MAKLRIYILHGWAIDPNNESKWDAFRGQLADNGVDSVFLPIPGLSTPLEAAWKLSDYVSWLAAQLPASAPVLLLGHSFGGQLAVRFAAQHPDRVLALMLVDPAGVIDRHPLIRLKRAVFRGIATIGKKYTSSPLLQSLLYKVVREQDYNQASPIMKVTMRSVIADEVIADFAHITCPTEIIWGEADRVTPLRLSQHFITDINKSHLTVIPQARHSPQFTHPAQTAQAVLNFLGQQPWQ